MSSTRWPPERRRWAGGCGPRPARDHHSTCAAYGLIGRIFAAAAVAASEAAATAVDDLAGRAEAHAGRLHAAADDYRRAERLAAAGLSGVR